MLERTQAKMWVQRERESWWWGIFWLALEVCLAPLDGHQSTRPEMGSGMPASIPYTRAREKREEKTGRREPEWMRPQIPSLGQLMLRSPLNTLNTAHPLQEHEIRRHREQDKLGKVAALEQLGTAQLNLD